jgi:ABC-type multidrug transport system fused ATPase/permease subunit
MSGSSLARRIRAKAFACLLRQEVAYFDQPENNAGAICHRLSSDALAVTQMIGTRLAVILEAMALICVGFIIGCFYSWQLALLVYALILLFFFMMVANIRFQTRVDQCTDAIFAKASSVKPTSFPLFYAKNDLPSEKFSWKKTGDERVHENIGTCLFLQERVLQFSESVHTQRKKLHI